MALSILTLSSCAQAATPQRGVTPQPSATLERAPTRSLIAPSKLVPTGPAAALSRAGTNPATLIGTPAPSPSLSGEFVFAPGDGSLWIDDAATGRAAALVKATAEVFADAPAFSPDGKWVVYVETRLSATGVAQSSIHMIASDGKNDRVLAEPPDIKTSYGWPAFSPDGKWVCYTSAYPIPPNTQHSEIQRISSIGGAAQAILQDARSAVFSPDGAQLVFTRFNFSNFSASLWVADADGRNAKLIVPDDLFAAVSGTRFSPDGKWILFAASGPPTRPLPGALLLPQSPCEPQLLCALAGRAYADGLPWDLWLVSPDGKRFEQLTNVGFDSPWPAWSGDGKYIAIFEINGFYVLDVDRHVLSQWKAEGGHGIMDWWSQN